MSNSKTAERNVAANAFTSTMACVFTLFLACVAITCLNVCFNASSAYANSARTYWEGASSTGAIVASSDCPIVVEHETLTFNVQQLPQSYYESLEEIAAYQTSVTAEYLFSNPADYAVTATLVFPFGKTPDYLYYPWNTPDGQLYDDSALYGITVNGEPAEFLVRHTLSYPHEEFSLETDLSRMLSVYKEDPFFSQEIPVTKYVFEFSDLPEDNFGAEAVLVWTPSPNSRLLMMDLEGLRECEGIPAERLTSADASTEGSDQSTKPVMLSTWARSGETVTVYVFGQTPEEGIHFELFTDGTCDTPSTGNVELVELSSMVFAQFALQEWSDATGVLPYDWYNAMIDNLNCSATSWDNVENCIIVPDYEMLNLKSSLLRWYEYSITLPAGETLTNVVTAPLYPTIDESYDPAVYSYEYLLSPAQTWTSFGSLDIAINTPFYLINSEFITEGGTSPNASQSLLGSLFAGKHATRNAAGFSSFDNGYALSLDALPEGELKFSLSTDQSPRMKLGYQGDLIVKAVLGAIMLGIVVAGAVIVTRRSKKKPEDSLQQP